MSWTETRLKRLAEVPIVNGLGEAATLEDQTWPRYIRTTDFAGPRELRDSTLATLPPELAARATVRRGDLLMSAAGTVGKTYVHLSDESACFAGYLVRFRPKADVDPRFVSYWTETPLFLDQVEVGKVTSTIDNFSAGKYQNLRILVPPQQEQRAIADFLDTETARIDGLIDKKRRVMELLSERAERLRASAFSSLGRWKLKRVLRTPMAYGVLVPRFVEPEDGVPMARIGSLNPDGTIARDRLTYIDKSQALEYRRTETAVGDLVLSVVGSMGRSAVVDAASAGTNTNRPLARLQPVAALPARLLWHWTQTQFFLDQALLATSGDTAQPTLNLGSLAEFDTGLPDDPGTWRSTLERLDGELLPLVAAAGRLERQVTLLQEHRQALITAAVTGELRVPGAAA